MNTKFPFPVQLHKTVSLSSPTPQVPWSRGIGLSWKKGKDGQAERAGDKRHYFNKSFLRCCRLPTFSPNVSPCRHHQKQSPALKWSLFQNWFQASRYDSGREEASTGSRSVIMGTYYNALHGFPMSPNFLAIWKSLPLSHPLFKITMSLGKLILPVSHTWVWITVSHLILLHNWKLEGRRMQGF